jgi:hypothetical protein
MWDDDLFSYIGEAEYIDRIVTREMDPNQIRLKKSLTFGTDSEASLFGEKFHRFASK